MSTPASKVHKQCTYKDYKGLPDDKKYEILNGALYALAPSPSTQHQRILGNLFVSIKNQLKNHSEAFTEKHCIGAPDFIIEIVSPSSPSGLCKKTTTI